MVGQSHPFARQRTYRRFQELVVQFDEHLIGQRVAKEKLAIHVAEFEAGQVQKPGTPRVLLLIGPTGSGKTELCRSLADLLSLPIVFVNATELSHTSFQGQQIGSLVASLLHDTQISDEDSDLDANLLKLAVIEAMHQAPTLQQVRGIVVVDEIDKVTFLPEVDRRASQAQERHNLATQSMLLPLFEGGRMRVSGQGLGNSNRELDTSTLLVIASGSFGDERFIDVVRQRDSSAVTFQYGHWRGIHHGDLIRFGLMDELVGRIRTIIVLERWQEADTRRLVAKLLEDGAWHLFGYALRMDKDVLDRISEQANNLRLGARGAWIIFDRIKHHVFRGEPGIVVDHEAKTILLTREYGTTCWP
ncbi:MAG: clpX [Magnetococcales bacterium]|nr:clpX [Magnetococcales bacterium]